MFASLASALDRGFGTLIDKSDILGSWRGIPGALSEIFRNEGFFGLYRGHSLTLARAVPHAAIGYTVYEASRRVCHPSFSTIFIDMRSL